MHHRSAPSAAPASTRVILARPQQIPALTASQARTRRMHRQFAPTAAQARTLMGSARRPVLVYSVPRGSTVRLGLHRHRQRPAHCAPWVSTLPNCLHPLASRVQRLLDDTVRLAQSLPQVLSVLRVTTVWVEPVISRHAVRTQASTVQVDLHLQQEHSAPLVFTVREVRVTSNRVPWARTLPMASLSTAQSARPGRFQHLQALCQKVLAPSVQ
jgi:hypothetical protein